MTFVSIVDQLACALTKPHSKLKFISLKFNLDIYVNFTNMKLLSFYRDIII